MCRIPIAHSPIPNPLGDSSGNSRPRGFFKSQSSFDAFVDVLLVFLMVLPGILAVSITLILSNFGDLPEHSRTRQVILDVPESSRVDAQVTSGDNTVNLQNL